jgi:hypothetical protein
MTIQGTELIKQSDLTPSTLHGMLVRHRLSAELTDDGCVILVQPGWKVFITIATADVNKIFYSSSATFQPGLSLSKRMSIANDINKKIIGATYVNGDQLRSAGWIPFEGGILTSTVVKTLVDFRMLFEDALADSEEGVFV